LKTLNNLRTNLKLIGSFLIIALITSVVGWLGISYIRQIDAADRLQYENYTKPTGILVNLSTAFQRSRVNTRDLLLAKTPEEASIYITNLSELESTVVKLSAE